MIHHLRDMIGTAQLAQSHPTLGYVRAVPLPFYGGLFDRIRDARVVIAGKAFAVRWPEGGELEKALCEGVVNTRPASAGAAVREPAAAFKLYNRLMTKREEAASFAQEQADFTEGPAGSIEREYRARAGAFAEAAEMVKEAEDVRHPLGMAEGTLDEPMPDDRFAKWSNADCAAQCRMQAREHLDPELTAFWLELSARLTPLHHQGQEIRKQKDGGRR